ncbi:hypothetical protein [Enterococcus olivae]
MVSILKKIDVGVEMENVYLIPKPRNSKKVLLEVKDKNSVNHLSNYTFIDEIVSTIGFRHLWNNYKNSIEEIVVSVTKDHKYKIKLPENLRLIGVYLS